MKRPRRVVRLRAAPLRDRLRALLRAGEPRPFYAVGEYRVSLSELTGGLYGSRTGVYLGSVGKGGRFRPSPDARARDIEALTAILGDPLGTARAAALATVRAGYDPRCATCGRPLTGPDREVGIGAKCFEKGEWYKLEEKTK